jgi:hypothetical protein
MAEEHDEAKQQLEKALAAVKECYREGPVTGVLITVDNDNAMIEILTLNQPFPAVFRVLMHAMSIVHDRDVAGSVTNNYNLH